MSFVRGIDFLDAKIAWAETRLKEFQALVSAHVANPCRIARMDDPIHQRHIRQIHFRPTSHKIGLLLGEYTYALRSGLDQLTWQLSLLTTPTPYAMTQFPIHEADDAQSDRTFKRQLKNVPAAAVDVIRNLQPYKRGAAFKDDALWKLGELCNLDKHRVWAARSTDMTVFAAPNGFRRFDHNSDSESLVEFSWPLSQKREVILKPTFTDLVFGEPINAPGLSFEITRGDIAELHRYVRDEVRPRFAPFFS